MDWVGPLVVSLSIYLATWLAASTIEDALRGLRQPLNDIRLSLDAIHARLADIDANLRKRNP